MKVSREAKIGVIVTASLAILIVGFFFLKGINIFSSQKEFYAVYKKIDGLVESSGVTINGLKVGHVHNVSLHPNRSGKILVSFYITEKDFSFPSNSVARIYSADLLGTKAIEIFPGTSNTPAVEGDTLKSDQEADLRTEVNRQILPLKTKAEVLISSIDSVLTIVQTILNKDARNNLNESFSSINLALKSFERTARRIDHMVIAEKNRVSSILTNMDSISLNLKRNEISIDRILDNFATITDSLSQSQLKATIDSTRILIVETKDILTKINNGEGTVGKLINNDSLYQNLNNSAQSMDLLLKDLKKNPARYVHFSVFGKKVDDESPKKNKSKVKE